LTVGQSRKAVGGWLKVYTVMPFDPALHFGFRKQPMEAITAKWFLDVERSGEKC
jgi:hypothetical protein